MRETCAAGLNLWSSAPTEWKPLEYLAAAKHYDVKLSESPRGLRVTGQVGDILIGNTRLQRDIELRNPHVAAIGCFYFWIGQIVFSRQFGFLTAFPHGLSHGLSPRPFLSVVDWF